MTRAAGRGSSDGVIFAGIADKIIMTGVGRCADNSAMDRRMKQSFQIVDRVVTPQADGAGNIVLYTNPDEGERRFLIDELKIDDHTLRSALDPDELARVEFEPEHTALIFKRPKNYSSEQQLLFGVSSAGVFLFRDGLRVVAPEEAALFDGGARQRCDSLAGVVLRLMSRTVGHFREHLRAINRVADELQGEINRSMENKHLIGMFALEKSLVYYVSALNSNGAVLEKLKHSSSKLGFSPDELEVLEDLIIDNNQCAKQAEMTSNILASLMDARASIVANNINVLMKRLNVITIAIMVPTLVVSAFSMNVPIPFQDHPVAFYVIHVIALLSAGAFLYLWKRLTG
jgi:magnesium transporter